MTLVKFPLRDNKAPAIPKGVDWRTWSTAANTPMVGVAVPKGIFIIDLDLYKGVTHAQVEAMVGCSIDWSAAELQRTLRGGIHYAFSVPDGLTQGQDIGGLIGFDTRAAGDGYIATGQGYTVLNPMGLDWALSNPALLPALPQTAIEFFSQSHCKVSRQQLAGLPPVAQNFAQFIDAQPLDIPIAEVERYLSLLPDTAADSGDMWLRVGMAIYHQTQGSDEGWFLFDEFSQRTTRPDAYNEKENWSRWCSLGNKGGKNPVTFASIIQYVNSLRVQMPTEDEISADAHELKRSIEWRLSQQLGDEYIERFQVSAAVLHLIITGVFWSATGRDIRLLSDSENLNQHKGSDGFKFIKAKFGNVLDHDELELAIKIVAGLNQDDPERLAKVVHASVASRIMDYLEYNNQRSSIRYSSDMFAERSIMELDQDFVNIVYRHAPLEVSSSIHSKVDPRVVPDYLQHFPRLPEILKFIAAARFARDRKKAYLWVHAPSDWGKGLFMGALEALGCAVEVSMTDIERMLEGSPTGHSPESFKRKFVLSLNEVKAIKREVKEIERTIRMSPKFQMATSVDVYAKILWSADNIPSLVGEEGVEDQLANRISVFKEEGGPIDARPLVREIGTAAYLDNMAYYIRDELNAMLNAYIAMGRVESEKAAQQYLNEFHGQYNVGRMYGTLSDAIPRMAEQIIADIKATPMNDLYAAGIHNAYGTDEWYLSKPKKFVGDWIYNTYSRAELATHAPRVDDLVRLISADGTGKAKPVRNGDKVSRMMLLKT